MVRTELIDIRPAMRVLASGLVVVTAWVDDRPWGMTVTACCSLSTEPPRLLVSLRSDTLIARTVREQNAFGINVLARNQQDVAQAGSAPGAAKYLDDFCTSEAAAGGGPRHAPRVVGALATLQCTVHRRVEVGDHSLFVGDVHDCRTPREVGEPLLYFDRSYRQIGEEL
jgi:flavin reductase (DIM6/NTAB) family NADH-FMN oxidoreductase RutF